MTKNDTQKAVNPRILAVDDEEVMGYLLKRVAKHLGYEVDWVKNCRTALCKLKQNTYQIILSDFRLPDMSGEAFYDAVCAEHAELVQRMIFITGDAVHADTREFLHRVEAPYLSKPFDIEELKLVIDTVAAG